ncbi:MAG: thioesterase family protein [Caulobacteraceae bacterium]|nr:thioesterase family protein [Caulobacteraceae bacterium]
MGHLNVRFYVAKALEGLVVLAAAMGLDGAFRPNALATLLVKDQHIRFLREARPGAALHMTAGVLEVGESDARLLFLLHHSSDGELASAFHTVVVHATARETRPFPWSDETRAKADSIVIAAPERARPRSVALDAVPGEANLAAADRLGLHRLAAGAFGGADCDVFGRMRPEVFIGRVSDGVPTLAAALRGPDAEPMANRGGAVLEYRLVQRAWPRAGDRFVIRSGLAGVDARTQRLVHWMLDPETGRAWGTAEAVAVALDLEARRVVPISEADQARLHEKITPGLAL